MKDPLNPMDLLRAELMFARQATAKAQAAALQLKAAHDDQETRANRAVEVIAMLMYRSGDVVLEFSEADERLTFEATWFRTQTDTIEDDETEERFLRVTLLPVTDEERARNEALREKTAEDVPLLGSGRVSEPETCSLFSVIPAGAVPQTPCIWFCRTPRSFRNYLRPIQPPIDFR